MKKSEIAWAEDGWTLLQEADAEKHILEISCRAEGGKVMEVRIRHHDGDDTKATATQNGENVLPMALADFKKLFKKGKLEIK